MYMAIPSTIQKLPRRPTSEATGRDSWNNCGWLRGKGSGRRCFAGEKIGLVRTLQVNPDRDADVRLDRTKGPVVVVLIAIIHHLMPPRGQGRRRGHQTGPALGPPWHSSTRRVAARLDTAFPTSRLVPRRFQAAIGVDQEVLRFHFPAGTDIAMRPACLAASYAYTLAPGFWYPNMRRMVSWSDSPIAHPAAGCRPARPGRCEPPGGQGPAACRPARSGVSQDAHSTAPPRRASAGRPPLLPPWAESQIQPVGIVGNEDRAGLLRLLFEPLLLAPESQFLHRGRVLFA